MIRYDDYISPEEYLGLRKLVGWRLFPLEEARNCVAIHRHCITTQMYDESMDKERLT